MFHGVMNPTAAGLTTKTAILFVDQLGLRVFEEMNTRSGAYFEAFLRDSQKCFRTDQKDENEKGRSAH
jgi:hypothetical protein